MRCRHQAPSLDLQIKPLGAISFLDGGLVDKVPLEMLAERINAEVIIVHYISSQNLREGQDAFLSKLFTPRRRIAYL